MSLETNHLFHISKFPVNTYHSFKNEALNEKNAIPLFDLFSYMQSPSGLLYHGFWNILYIVEKYVYVIF